MFQNEFGAAGRRIGDEEALAIGQAAEARVVGEVAARLARAVQRDDQWSRLVGPGRRVQEDLALALGRVDRQGVVARRQARGRAGRGLRCVVDRLRSRLPGDERDERKGGDEDAGRPRVASGHAGTARAKTKSQQSTTGRIAAGPTGSPRRRRSAGLHRRPRHEAAEELPGPPRRGKRRGLRLGPRPAGPAVGPAIEAHVLDARPGGAVRARRSRSRRARASAGRRSRGSRRGAATAPTTASRWPCTRTACRRRGTTWSAVPWISSTGSGRSGLHGAGAW